MIKTTTQASWEGKDLVLLACVNHRPSQRELKAGPEADAIKSCLLLAQPAFIYNPGEWQPSLCLVLPRQSRIKETPHHTDLLTGQCGAGGGALLHWQSFFPNDLIFFKLTKIKIKKKIKIENKQHNGIHTKSAKILSLGFCSFRPCFSAKIYSFLLLLLLSYVQAHFSPFTE